MRSLLVYAGRKRNAIPLSRHRARPASVEEKQPGVPAYLAQCIPPPPAGAAPGRFLLSRNASNTSPIDIYDSSMYTSW